MYIQLFDWLVIAVYFVVILFIAGYYAIKSKKNTEQFFLSGRNLPWYISGTAMVATTFSADTPLAVTELVAKNGISGNWLWWNMAIGGMLTVFFFAKLWRRAGIITDLELIEIRYSGKPAAMLRGARSIYLGVFMNAIILGWVHKAMEKIFSVTLPGIDAFWATAVLAVIVALYSLVSGLTGTARTDSIQFLIAITGCVILAVVVVNLPQIGSVQHLKSLLPEQSISFLPAFTSTGGAVTSGILALTFGAFITYALIQWWATWYPGADPGGGGYIAQRMMAAKNEQHSVLSTLWFNIAHYTIRPWPWIIVALAALVILPRSSSLGELKLENPLYYNQAEHIYKNPGLKTINNNFNNNAVFKAYYDKYENTIDPGRMFPKLMARYLPAGLLGLMIAVFLSAYMSTIASQLNWGTSYLINDFYRRFIKPKANEKHLVNVSRVIIFFQVILSLMVSKYALHSISSAWEFILNASAGIGAVLILRWYWWRINAWSEISAMLIPFIIYPISKNILHLPSPVSILPTVIGSTIVWLLVTFLTKPEKREILENFYKRIQPGGLGWRKIAANIPGVEKNIGFGRLFINWLCGVIAIYSALYGMGKIIFAEYYLGTFALLITVVCGIIIYFNFKDKGSL